MKFYVGLTDYEWFTFLSRRGKEDIEDINFWQPGGNTGFKVLKSGEPFLFKLKSPYYAIAGIGFFSSHSILPLDIAWNVFGQRNGVESYRAFRTKIEKYRRVTNSYATNTNIGCIVLNNPIFFDKEDWIPAPKEWGKSIVSGKSYDATTPEGGALWNQVESTLARYPWIEQEVNAKDQLVAAEPESDYSRRYLTKVRIGQGAFRVQLTDAYQRKCSITGEKTLPVLEAAHIKPYAESGPHQLSNGILLRADLHKLYDSGYLTFTPDYKVEVSQRIREEFENGREYYAYHGQDLKIIPMKDHERPQSTYIDWHNTHIYKG